MIRTLVGDNSYALSQRLSELKQEFIKKNGSAGVEQFDGEATEWQELETALFGVSLFASEKLVIIKNISSNKDLSEKLIEKLESAGDSTEVVLIEAKPDKRTALYKFLRKKAELEEFWQPSEIELQKWAIKEIADQGGKISSAEARFLVEHVGSDQQRLKHEIDKLVAYQPEVSRENIEMLVERSPRDTIFELLQLALTKQTDRALAKLEALEQAREDPFQLLGMVIWQVNILAIVASAKDVPSAQIAKDFKINPFVVQKTADLKRRMSSNEIKRIVQLVAEADVRLKSEGVEAWNLLKQLVIEIG